MTLIQTTYALDDINQSIPVETERTVFARVRNVSFNEWNEGGKRGMQPQWKVDIFPYDYNGETSVVYNGVRYSVYRTYQVNEDVLELYLEERSGDVN